jgi:hypothetical protein
VRRARIAREGSGGLCEEGDVPHTPDRPVHIAGLFPELAGQERPTVRLHPRRGRPGPQDSSIGGPLLWPAAEPWPRCDAPDRHIIFAPIGTGEVGRTIKRPIRDPRRIAAPMVAVAQLFARDVPGLPVPPSADVCQVLWCPTWNHEPDYAPRIQVRWRDSARDPGMGGDLATAPPSDPEVAMADFIPQPCSVSPERTIDYPTGWELPKELVERIGGWGDANGWIYDFHLSAAPGTKVGGWPVWVQDPEWPTCPRGHAMDHLLTVASWEYDGESWRTWRPPDLPDGHEDAGLMLGDAGNVYVFTCVACDDRPIASLLQSS